MTETKPRGVPKSVSECFDALQEMANATRGTIEEFEMASERAASLWLAHGMVCTGWLQAIQAEPKPEPDQETSRKVMEAVGDWCDSERMRIRLTSRVLIEEVHPDELAIVDAFAEEDPPSFYRPLESQRPSDDCFAEKLDVVSTVEERMSHANELLRVIAGCGRQFFWYDDIVAEFVMDPRKGLRFQDHFAGGLIDPLLAGAWKGFTGGGRLKDLVFGMACYVKHGHRLPSNTFGPWPKSRCNGDLWGYGKHMHQVRGAAKRLGLLATRLPSGDSR